MSPLLSDIIFVGTCLFLGFAGSMWLRRRNRRA